MVSIVIVNWNAGFLLKDCVESVLNYSDGLVKEVIIVDNASSDDSLQQLPRHDMIRIIRNAENKGK